MKYPVTVKRLMDGKWQARYLGGQWVEPLTVVSETREALLDRMKETIRYHIEWCP